LTKIATVDDPERLSLSKAQAEVQFEAWRKKSVNSSLIKKIIDIPHALLSSGDITQVVLATGAVSPFHEGGGRKSRLKKASYEGRIGSKAYEYRSLKRIRAFKREFDIPFVNDKYELKEIFDETKDKGLVVPKNGIIFVETDLDFRIPDFIALRFNLQIKHVHRGLLLGTGPLVDPGFVGKLCIPIHNLTDEDYYIDKDDGLIWIEFTKTSLDADKDDEARAPLEGNEFQGDIRTLIEKAALRYPKEKIAIRSSLPVMFDQATESARKAETASKVMAAFNVLGVVGAVIAIGGLLFAASNFMSGLSGRNEDLAGELKAKVERQQREINTLSDQVLKLQTEIDKSKPASQDPERPKS
jgi:deoxycytidine triphosphate deaminase